MINICIAFLIENTKILKTVTSMNGQTVNSREVEY